jgi:hypothetical protein
MERTNPVDTQPLFWHIGDMSTNYTPFARALASVEEFSDKAVAVMPETPSEEMLRYVAHVTGEDIEKLYRLYQMFLTTGRLDQLGSACLLPSAGFAED